jgi:hypothetical protein
MIISYIYTFGLTESKRLESDVRVITSQREQYRGPVHLFIGTGHSPDKITFMSLITNHNYDTNYQGLCGLFLFKSVASFVSNMSLCRSSFNCSFGIHLDVTPACMSSWRRCSCSEDLRRRRRPPNSHVFEDLRKTKAPNSSPSQC